MPAEFLFTDRLGGHSLSPYDSLNLGAHVGDCPEAVAANRAELARRIGVDKLVFMEQTHSANVAVVGKDTASPLPDTDALVTAEHGVALVVLVADCTPVVLIDDGVIGVAHAGRVGAEAGILPATVATMVKLGADPTKMTMHLGPAASGSRYELPEAMAQAVNKQLPGSLCRTLQGTWGIDVRAGLAAQAAGLGITQVHVDPRCTIAEETLFSYRREGTTGRQAGVVWQ